MTQITVNGRGKHVDLDYLTYEDAVRLAFEGEAQVRSWEVLLARVWSITWHMCKAGCTSGGIITREVGVALEDGMAFNIADTSRA